MKKITILLLIGAGLNAAMIHTMGPGAGAAPAGAGGPAQQQQRRIVPLKVKAARTAAQAWHDGTMTGRDLRVLPRKFQEEVERQYGVIAARALHDQVRNAQYYFQLSPILKVNILRQFYLEYREHAPDAFVDNARGEMNRKQYFEQAYRFSIQELLDAGRIPEITRHGGLRLNKLYIGSLDGLKNIPGIDGVTFLRITGNQIENIGQGAFPRLANLTLLYLGGNQIKAIVPGAFEGLDNLRRLYLRENQIKAIVPGAFDGLDNLRTLNLGENQIKAIVPGAFRWLANLEELNLGENQIKAIGPRVFQGLANLEELNLGENQIETITPEEFLGIRGLHEIFLRNNPLSQESKQRLSDKLRKKLPNITLTF